MPLPSLPCSWEAVLVVLDSQPFAGLPHILQDLNDTRVWVFAEWIAPEYAPKTSGAWNTGYHDLLYNLTDEAGMAACCICVNQPLSADTCRPYTRCMWAALGGPRAVRP